MIWRLSKGKFHITDVTNASRTLLYDIHNGQWDEKLLAFFNIPAAILPTVVQSSGYLAVVDKSYFGVEIPITGIAGDQQAALVGQACFKPGMVKSTFGFILMNTGHQAVQSKNRLLTTIAYGIDNKITYGLEGSVFVAGAALQWLRDALHLIQDAKESEVLAVKTQGTQGVYLVPAFAGLGAPYWDPKARGAIVGLTRDTGIAHIVRAALEATCYQTKDLFHAFHNDISMDISSLRVDGGMAVNDWLMQFLADILDLRVTRPEVIEISALGAALLAALGVDGGYTTLEELSACWRQQREFAPQMAGEQRKRLYDGWKRAVQQVATPR